MDETKVMPEDNMMLVPVADNLMPQTDTNQSKIADDPIETGSSCEDFSGSADNDSSDPKELDNSEDPVKLNYPVDSIEPVDPDKPVEPDTTAEPEESVELIEPEDRVTPVEPVVSVDTDVAKEPIEPEYPEDAEETARPITSSGKKVDPALIIARDFLKHNSVAVIGEALYLYNGIFYELFTNFKAQRLLLKLYTSQLDGNGAFSIINNAMKYLKNITENVYDEFPINPKIIVFQNGMLDIDAGSFRGNSSVDIVSSALGIHYNPDQRDMPYTESFLRTIADGSDNLYERILQVIGYILSNDIKAKSFFYLQGVPNSGKSLFCALLALFFPESGPNSVGRIPLQDFGDKFALAGLTNKKLNISEDLPDRPLTASAVSKVKQISDSNRIDCEDKFISRFTVKPLYKLLFASNHPLTIRDSDEAFANRVVNIPFSHAIPKDIQDKSLLDKMKPELSALFNHALQAYQRLVANNYCWAGDFPPDIQVVNSGMSFDKTEIIEFFVEDCCELNAESITSVEDLRSAYNEYCREHGYQTIVGDRFSREFKAVHPKLTRVKISNQKRGYRGIRIKNI